MSELVLIGAEVEAIAVAMVETRGDLAKASRSSTIQYNAMALRAVVRENPDIRKRYHELLTIELQESGLHIAERILDMVALQKQHMGGPMEIINEAGEKETIDMPADTKMVIELSKEISRLIAEGKGQNMSARNAQLIASKEDALELLKSFLES
jgi:hypothetical protein